MSEVTDILRENKEAALNDLVSTLVETVPMYARTDPKEMRERIDQLFELFLEVVDTKDATNLTNALSAISTDRIKQGFSAADFIRALLLVYPVVRNVVRKAGPRNDVTFAHMFGEVENAVFRIVAVASNIYAAGMTRSSEAKAAGLEQQNEFLKEHERALQREAREHQQALQAAQEFNSRVISSLTSGVAVIEHTTMKVLLWSGRAEEITGISAADAVGKNAREVVAPLKGLRGDEVIATVQATDRLPLTKMHIETPQGVKRSIFLRGERLRSGEGSVKGTVIVLDDITERELLIDSFSRYVSKEVVQRLLSGSHKSNRLEGERRACSVLFADIRGFTGLSERITLEELHELLNQYFRVMIDHCAAHDGVIDKFIGDKIMSVFSSGKADGAVSAAHAALAIQAEIGELNAARAKANLEPIEVGIGINTGEVVMGTVGSEERMSFTVIGDSVNVADRLQSLAGPGEIYVGARTRAILGDKFEVEALGARALRGRSHPEEMFRLLKAL